MVSSKDIKFKPHILNLSRKVKKAILLRSPSLRGHPIFIKSKYAMIKLDNGIEVSIIQGPMFFCNSKDTYEVMATGEEDPVGYLTMPEVLKYIRTLEHKPKV